MMRSGNHGGGARRRPGRRQSALVAGMAMVFSLMVASAGAASAKAAPPGPAPGAVSATHGVVTHSAVDPSTVEPNVVRPLTGTGCHTYNYWNGAHVCMTVYGNGLNVQSVTGETDGPDSDWGKLWDTAGVVTIYGHPTNHYLSVSWASGGGIWLANGDNFCFTDTTLGQTACVTVRS
jgi:hypothetical protein